MKNILVPIDFSLASLNALEYAVKIAEKISANIMLMWVDNNIAREEFARTRHEKNAVDIREKMQEICETIMGDRLKNSKVDFKIRHGKVEEEIANQAKYSDMDLVICGTTGMGNARNTGTTAFRIISMLHTCPVITVPTNYTIADMKEKMLILLPIDSTPETRQKTDDALWFARLWDAEIYILGLYSSKLSSLRRKVDQYVQQIANYFTQKEISFRSEMKESDNITRTSLEAAKQLEICLIVIMKEQEIATQNIFLGPYAQQMIFTSSIPVMSVAAKDIAFISDPLAYIVGV